MKGGFELGVGKLSAVGSAAEERMSQGTAETLVEKDQEDGNFHSLVGQAIGVTLAVTLEQAVGTHLAQVVAELIQPMAGRSEKRMYPIRVIHESWPTRAVIPNLK